MYDIQYNMKSFNFFPIGDSIIKYNVFTSREDLELYSVLGVCLGSL